MASVEEMKRELQAAIDSANQLLDNMEASIANDAVSIASQTGRLDFLSAVLATLSIILAVGGVVAFFEIRSKAKAVAEQTAKNECKPLAEKLVTAYLNDDLPDEVRRHVESLIPTEMQEDEDYGSEKA